MDKKVPLYQVIKNDIKNSIRNGTYRPNDKILSESELGRQYHTSRITIVRALTDLVSEGIIWREHGKGSFVNNTIQENIMQLTGFSERMSKLSLSLETKILEVKKTVIPQEMAAHFQITNDVETIFVKRLRIVNNKRLCLSFAYFIAEGNDWLLAEDYQHNSIYDVLENHCHRPLGDGVQRISVGFLDKDDASQLSMQESDPLLKLTLFTALQNGQPFEYDTTYYNPSLYEYEMKLCRNQ